MGCNWNKRESRVVLPGLQTDAGRGIFMSETNHKNITR